MDAVKMQYEFDNLVRNHDKFPSGKDIASDDIQMWLNNAQSILTNKYIELYNKEEFARTVIGELIRVKRYALSDGFTDTTNLENGIYFELPSGLRANIPKLEEVQMTIGTDTFRDRVIPVTGKHYSLNKNNPFKQPYEGLCWRIGYGLNSGSSSSKVHQVIIPSTATLVYYFLHYIKDPADISISGNTTSELNEAVHDELVIKAVDLFLKSENNSVSLDKVESLSK